MATVTHNFVSAVTDDDSPSGAVGPDEWNANHDVSVSFEELNDTDAYSGNAGKVLVVNASENGVAYRSAGSLGGETSHYPNPAPDTPNTMDDEFDDATGMSGTGNGLNARWTVRGTAATSFTYSNSWLAVQAAAGNWGMDQARPAAQDFTVEAKLSIDGYVGTSNSLGGLMLYDAVNGDAYGFYLLIGNSSSRVFDLEVSKWGNSGSFLGGAFTNLKSLTNAPPPTNIRMLYTHSSTGINFDASYDGGLNWVNIWSETSDVIGFTRVGVFMSTGRRLGIDYFRRTA